MNSSEQQQHYIDLLNTITNNIYKHGGRTVFILSTLGNLIVIMAFLTKSWRKNVCAFYLICYTLAGLCFVTVFMSNTIMNNTCISSINICCKLYLYFFYLFATLAPNILIFASIDRLLISSQNIDARLYSSKRLAHFSIGISSILRTIYYIYIPIRSGISDIGCLIDQSEPYISFVYFSLAATNLFACSTITVLLIISFKNVQLIRKIRRQQQQRTQRARAMKKKDFQLLSSLYILNIIHTFFSMLSLTYDIIYALVLQDKHNHEMSVQQAIYSFLSNIFNFLLLIPYISCFGVLLLFSKAFRHELKRICYKIVGKYLMPLREEENNPHINIVGGLTQ